MVTRHIVQLLVENGVGLFQRLNFGRSCLMYLFYLPILLEDGLLACLDDFGGSHLGLISDVSHLLLRLMSSSLHCLLDFVEGLLVLHFALM